MTHPGSTSNPMGTQMALAKPNQSKSHQRTANDGKSVVGMGGRQGGGDEENDLNCLRMKTHAQGAIDRTVLLL